MKILVTCAHGTATGSVMKAKVEQALQEFAIPVGHIHHYSGVPEKLDRQHTE